MKMVSRAEPAAEEVELAVVASKEAAKVDKEAIKIRPTAKEISKTTRQSCVSTIMQARLAHTKTTAPMPMACTSFVNL